MVDEGRARLEEAVTRWTELGVRAGATRALVGVCQVLVALGQVERAESLSRELLERWRDDVRDAEKRYRESLRAALELGDVIETSFEVQGIAMANRPE